MRKNELEAGMKSLFLRIAKMFVLGWVCLFGFTGCMTPGPLQDGQLFGCQTYSVSGDKVFVYQCGASLERLSCVSDYSTTQLGAAGEFETYLCS